MKFILPTGESKIITVELVASTFQLTISEAENLLRRFEQLVEGKLFKPDEIRLTDLALLLMNNQRIEQLLKLLHASFPSYFDDEKIPAAAALSSFLKIEVSYDLMDDNGSQLVEKNVLHRLVVANHLTITFNDEDIFNPDDATRRKTCSQIRTMLAKIKVGSFVVVDQYAKICPAEVTIPWFFVPTLNKNLKKLGFDVESKAKNHLTQVLSLKN